MKLIEYSSDKYGRIPNYIETGYYPAGEAPSGNYPVSRKDDTTVKQPATSEVSDFVFVFVLCIIVFLMLWK